MGEFYFDTLPHTLSFTFDQEATASDWNVALKVLNLSTGAAVPAEVAGTFNTALNSIIYKLNFNDTTQTGTPLSSGNYVAILDGSIITSTTTGLQMVGADGVAGDSYAYNFFFGLGDLNHDHFVDLGDVATIVANFNGTSGHFSQGDLNYDGHVNVLDINLLLPLFSATTSPLDSPVDSSVTSAGDDSVQIAWTAPWPIQRSPDTISTAIPPVSPAGLRAQATRIRWIRPCKRSPRIRTSSYPRTMTTPAATVENLVAALTALEGDRHIALYQTPPQQLTFSFNQSVSW